jgi:anthranilate/para-aminobenzoate synthase component I
LRGPLLRDVSWDLSRDAFCAAVRETHESIRAGDVYVLNLTARLEGESVADSPEEAFASLAARASADMAALVTGLPGAVPWIASVSPERFVRVRRAGSAATGARIVEIEPIKGTRPRGSDPSTDVAIADGLLADAKERAEHVMVVDMERNDLGMVCVPGSIHVDPLYEIVTTPYCHQLVSRVRGAMRPEATFAELLRAVFPCGSITGAPKRSAIRIADGLEATPRGAYCGSLLVALPGELDSSVIIRTLEGIADKPERARYGAGCGITIDSDPDAEYEEAVLKASLVAGP